VKGYDELLLHRVGNTDVKLEGEGVSYLLLEYYDKGLDLREIPVEKYGGNQFLVINK